MNILKKLSALICAAAVSVTASVTAFASYAPKGLGTELVSSGKLASGKEDTVLLTHEGSYTTYDIEVGKKGTLEIELNSRITYLEITVFDSKKRSLIISDLMNYYGECYTSSSVMEAHGGYFPDSYPKNAILCVADGLNDGYHGVLSFPVSKGKYTIAIKRYMYEGDAGNSNVTIRADYPKASTSAKINYLTINLKKGDTLSLGASVSGSGTVKWSSSKPTVAAVSSSGKVTAKKSGSAIITAKCGSSSQKIKIVVS